MSEKINGPEKYVFVVCTGGVLQVSRRDMTEKEATKLLMETRESDSRVDCRIEVQWAWDQRVKF